MAAIERHGQPKKLVPVAFTPAEKLELKKRARVAGLSMSAFIRFCAVYAPNPLASKNIEAETRAQVEKAK